MRILLVGEYSTLHNSLREGLLQLGHEVVLMGDGDGFKNLKVDISYRSTFFKKPFIHTFTKGIFKILNFDFTALERGIRFWLNRNSAKGFEVVQLINEQPIKTIPWLERFLLKYLFKNNEKVLLLACGVDHLYVKYLFENKDTYSLIIPYLNNEKAKENYQYVLEYLNKNSIKTHELVYKKIKGVIASDYDYLIPLKGHQKFMGLIPNPVNIDKILNDEPHVFNSSTSEIIIFHGINESNYYKKGSDIFCKVLELIQKKYPSKVKTVVVRSLPYQDYLKAYAPAHILLDQIYAYDQGYNALEAMARGKVVFTGAEQEFLDHYGLKADEVCINALPDVDYLVEKLSMLIENPEKIKEIGQNARAFIEREHHYIKIAERYLDTWLKA